MFDYTLFSLSLGDLQDLVVSELTIFHLALFYVLAYVVYKALGRYIYFKPQEHASKINRTFLVISILVVMASAMNGFTDYLPILPEYRWFYVASGLVLLLAPLSIITARLIWKYDREGSKDIRLWHYDYLPIPSDYFKTTVSKSEREGYASYTWEEEGVESTTKNIHSDVLLNILALAIFIITSGHWAYLSAMNYGWSAYTFSIVTTLTISGIFLDTSVFSWIRYLQRKAKSLFKH